MNMLKHCGVAFLVHIILFALIWVGFSVPMSRPVADFAYLGSFMPTQDVPGSLAVTSGLAIELKTAESAFFSPWIQMRDLNKPRK